MGGEALGPPGRRTFDNDPFWGRRRAALRVVGAGPIPTPELVARERTMPMKAHTSPHGPCGSRLQRPSPDPIVDKPEGFSHD
jgi:hypothetical protein